MRIRIPVRAASTPTNPEAMAAIIKGIAEKLEKMIIIKLLTCSFWKKIEGICLTCCRNDTKNYTGDLNTFGRLFGSRHTTIGNPQCTDTFITLNLSFSRWYQKSGT